MTDAPTADAPRKSFLLATFEGGGSVPPFVELARRLVARGHRVRLMSDACNRPEALAADARFVPWTTAPSKIGRGRAFDYFQDWAAPTPFEGILAACRAVFTGPALAFAGDVMNELAREPADLVVANELLFGVHLGCEAAAQNTVLLGVNINLFPAAGALPMGPGLMPARSADEAAAHEAMRTAIREALDAATLPGFNAARIALGLAPLASLADQHKATRGLLLATSRAFDFAPEPMPDGLRYVGPLLGDPGWAAPFASPFARDDRRPLVLVAFGTTFQNHAGAVQRVMEALGPLPIRGVVTLGGALVRSDLGTIPDNVAVVESAPHGALMREAAVVVTHGGHGTVMKALANACPMLVMPHGRDQADNAARIAARGAGLPLAAGASVAEIRAALVRLLEEPAFTTAAVDLGRKVQAEAEASPLLSLLEAMAATPPRSGTLCAA
ncbi:nucleotide disphospho-sugar-binding domain-containing protein [Xanthobacter sp. V4C-4]|uniref:nucleotide disphospho-sugar-binding domain-containing protein n=1 Tax=Xanthobacter cornucopiae TaxID=3119924 RepID=UPI003728CE33